MNTKNGEKIDVFLPFFFVKDYRFGEIIKALIKSAKGLKKTSKLS
ncbi:MAG: hypothetical protein ACERIH_12040 [Labilibaculum antarcticum]